MVDYIDYGAGDVGTEFPDGQHGFTDSNGIFDKDGKAIVPNNPVAPAVTSDFQGPPPTNSIFTPLAYHQYDGFTQWMDADPMAYRTSAGGLQIGYTSTPFVGTGNANNYSFAPAAQSLTLGLAGLSVSQTKLAAQTDWTGTADWDGKMRATMVQGGLFTYVNRLSNDDVTIDLNAVNAGSATTPSNQLAYQASGLSGSFNGQALAYNFSVNAADVADVVKLKVSYDFDGDGKTDRTELYGSFAIDANKNGFEDYQTSKLEAATGAAMQDLKNGSVKVELWRVSGNGDNVQIQTNTASSRVKLPYSGLTTADGGAVAGSTLYLQSGATAGGQASTLATAPNAQAGTVTDSTHAVPLPSIGGYAGPGQVWYNQDGVVGITINGQSYGIFADADVTWSYTPTGLKSSLDGSNYYSVALLPDATTSTLMEYRQHAFAEVTGTQANYTIDKATNQVVTTFTYSTQMMSNEAGLSSDPLTALYYHQYANSDASTMGFSFRSARGDMKAYDGSSFSTTMKMPPILPLMPFLGTDAQKAELQGLIHDELKTFLTKTDPLGGDTYWGSRQIAKYTDLAMLAQQVGYGQARDTFVQAAEKQLETWFTASDGDKYEFVYDKIWHAMIGYPGSYNADDKSNDLTLQLGYLVNAAATIATLDPEWAKQSNFGAMVNLVIKNANNPDRNDPTFGYLRGFDSYAGHNWASGTGTGITQESATESLNFDGAVARWGAATGQADMENLGLYLYSTESQAFADYYLDVHDVAFPEGFDHSRLGVLGADGGSYATYFGTDPLYVQGINETPILSQSSLFMGYYANEIREDFSELNAQMADPAQSDPNNAWWNSLDKYMAMADPDKALADYLSHTSYQGGGGEESKADTLAFIESLVAMGTIDQTVTANSPYAAVYGKNGGRTYVAWNPSTTTAATVNFSDGTKIVVGANDMATLTPDGQTHVTDFSAATAYWPDGIPLDLPTDPPTYALTQVARNGDLTLSVEATTGTAWLAVAGGQPRAMLNGDGTRLKVETGTDNGRLVAVGRDASGQIHVLLAGGANGREPFYDKLLNANFSLKDNGAALYATPNASTLEPLYGQDFNGDGVVVGGTLTAKAQNGQLQLFVDDGNGRAYVKDGAKPMIEVFRNRDGVPSLLTRGGSTLSAVGKDADGNIRVLDVTKGSDIVYSWKLDGKGNWTSETSYDVNKPGIADAEAIFQLDLNHDGVVPAALPQIVARNGDLQLLVDADGYALAKLENGTTISLTRNGDPVKLNRGSQLSAIGRDADGNLRVLDGDPNNFGPDSQHWAWQMNAAGNWSREDVYSGAAITQAEGLFGQDFNGDGVVTGGAKTRVEQNGDDALSFDQQTGEAYVSVHGAAPTLITRDGADWGDVQLQRGDWKLVAVATDDQGRTRVLDANPFSDMKYAWILDGNGHWSGEQSFDKSTAGAAELLFSTDLNKDGVIGDKPASFMAAGSTAPSLG